MQQIILQPNGKYAIFNTEEKILLGRDMSKHSVTAFFLQFQISTLLKNLDKIFRTLKKREDPYYGRAISFQKALEYHVGTMAGQEEKARYRQAQKAEEERLKGLPKKRKRNK